MQNIELLAPAGNLEKLKFAITYGADAVYIGGQEYGLRASSDNFTLDDMKEGIEYCHTRNKKIYLTMNIIPHNEDLDNMPEYIKKVTNLGIDAIILSDPGVYAIVKEVSPNMEIHLSTQANNTNWRSAKFWYDQGIKRIILARELSLAEIILIESKSPDDLNLEVFIHGAMCISYSGRCLLSNYMAGRDSNKGFCAHPCRWKYYLVEEKRPGQYMPIIEDAKGTYIYNSKDLCMIEHMPELIQSGVKSLKIEGRMKSSYYVACVVKEYRKAIDSYLVDPNNYRFDPAWAKEISKASHREYTTGFFFGKPTDESQIYNTTSYIRNYEFLGFVLEYYKETKTALIEQRNKITTGDEVEILNPSGTVFRQKINSIRNADKKIIDSAPHPQMMLYIYVEQDVELYSLIRKAVLD